MVLSGHKSTEQVISRLNYMNKTPEGCKEPWSSIADKMKNSVILMNRL